MDRNKLECLKSGKLLEIGIESLDHVENIYPCTPMQEGLLVSQIKNPGVQYKVLRFISIKPIQDGHVVDIGLLKHSWQRVVDRHPILRTIFVEETGPNGPFVQVVLDKVNANIKEEVNTSKGGDIPVLSKIKAEVQVIGNGVPHCMTIFSNQGANTINCRLEINHAIDDGMSTSIILKDWSRAYAGRLPLSKGPSYSHFVAFLQEQDSRHHLDYWACLLANISPCNFPAISETNAAKLDGTHSITISNMPTSELYAFCRRFEVSPFNVLQAAWSKVLKKYTGMDEVCFGYLTSGRNLPIQGVEGMAGPLLNILICRASVGDSNSLIDIVKNLRRQRQENNKHQTSSLSSIQRHLRLPSGIRLFNTIINFQRPITNDVMDEDTVTFELAGSRGIGEVRCLKILNLM
jgi:hypothetical protein